MENELFIRFRSLPVSTDTLGLEWKGEIDSLYFCTPIGAEIIGWTGVDGEHFCFIPKISSDMVFMVSPMPCGDHYVEPIARSFRDFLSLVLFCKDVNPLGIISYGGEKEFLESIESESDCVWPERDDALNALKTNLEIEEMKESYQYVKKLQAEFDYDAIPFSEEYYDVLGIG